jgi:hypothetical protein
VKLDESVEKIIDAVVAAIEAHASLAEVESVVRGDRARPMPALPSIWVVPQAARMTRGMYGDETWELPLSLAGLVKDDDPVQGGKDSQRLTALARSAALELMPAGIDTVDVTDITSRSFDPTARSSETNRTLYWTESVVVVSFAVTE